MRVGEENVIGSPGFLAGPPSPLAACYCTPQIEEVMLVTVVTGVLTLKIDRFDAPSPFILCKPVKVITNYERVCSSFMYMTYLSENGNTILLSRR